MAFFGPFMLEFLLFVQRVSSFRVALFRLFVFSHGVISLFRLFAWRYFAAKRRNGTNQPPYFLDMEHKAIPVKSKFSPFCNQKFPV